MTRIQTVLVSIFILLTGFSLLFWTDWRIGLGACLVYWAELIQNNIDKPNVLDPPPTLNQERKCTICLGSGCSGQDQGDMCSACKGTGLEQERIYPKPWEL